MSTYHPSIHPFIHPSLMVHSLFTRSWELGHDKLHMKQTTEPYIHQSVRGFPSSKVKGQKLCEPIRCKAFYKRLSVTLKESPKPKKQQSERERKERKKPPFTLTQERWWVGTNLPAKKHMTGKNHCMKSSKTLSMDNILGSTSQVFHLYFKKQRLY